MKSFAKSERFFQIGHTEQLRLLGQRFGNAHQPMPVGIRFHHREHFGRTNSLAHNLGVVA